MNELIAAGLNEINFSTGDEHTKFIPLESVMLAAKLSLEKLLPVLIMIELKQYSVVTIDTIKNHEMLKGLSEEAKMRLQYIESPWMPLNPSLIEKYPEGKVSNMENLAARGGCDSVLETYVIQANGKIGSCCGLGMRLIPELNSEICRGDTFLKEAIDKSEKDFLKLWLRYMGPEKILAWAAHKNPDIKWENMYAHKCQACMRMYKDSMVKKVIKENYEEMISEVLLTAYIDDIYAPNQFAKNIDSVGSTES
ncbi:MAG TPA: hypothetical protein VG603_08535 [Chitinophagales bacterium]|nr:hypothetical protein [Chitinophagales bacterium]